VFRFVRLAEFEILFVLFFLVAFLLFKDLVSTQIDPVSLLPERISFTRMRSIRVVV
jgi:hypothetical protein